MPEIFKQFPSVVAAMSLVDSERPADFSMATPDDGDKTGSQNRFTLARELNFEAERMILLKHTHSDTVLGVSDFSIDQLGEEGDALVTNQAGWLLAISAADCVPVLIYDPHTASYAAVHSGWRGSALNIVGKTVEAMRVKFGTRPIDIYAWLGPSANVENYEVEQDVVSQFSPKYSRQLNSTKWLFDNKSVVRDQLRAAGVKEEHIEVSELDTITNETLHSARRDKDGAGRMVAVIGVAL